MVVLDLFFLAFIVFVVLFLLVFSVVLVNASDVHWRWCCFLLVFPKLSLYVLESVVVISIVTLVDLNYILYVFWYRLLENHKLVLPRDWFLEFVHFDCGV